MESAVRSGSLAEKEVCTLQTQVDSLTGQFGAPQIVPEFPFYPAHPPKVTALPTTLPIFWQNPATAQAPPRSFPSSLIKVMFERARQQTKSERRSLRRACPSKTIQGFTTIDAKIVSALIRAKVHDIIIAHLTRAGYVYIPTFYSRRPPATRRNNGRTTQTEEEFSIKGNYRRVSGAAIYNHYVPPGNFT